MDIREKAVEFAKKYHKGQTRKFNGEPYVNHPIRVAEDAQEWDVDESAYDMLYTTGILHDVIEDTEATYETVKAEFGDNIAEVVQILTRQAGETYFDFIKRIAGHGPFAKGLNYFAVRVKVSDIQDNLRDLKEGSLKDKLWRR